MTKHADELIDAIRESSRQLVRELGFMGGDFAGTKLSPSAVHALIEIEIGGMTAQKLSHRLRLDKSSVSRMLRKLIEGGDVVEEANADGRVKMLSLTPAGRGRVSNIHAFGRAQVEGALGRLHSAGRDVVAEGLHLYAAALNQETDQTAGSAPVYPAKLTVEEGYRIGMIARIIQMHALYYADAVGFGQKFEAVVASGLAEFSERLDRPMNRIWTATQGDRIVGSIAIDGEDLGGDVAHLRWFIVDDLVRGSGAGRQLLDAALAFVDRRHFAETRLWTFAGLDAARHLYEKHGFTLAEERPGTQWGREVLEQCFVRISTNH